MGLCGVGYQCAVLVQHSRGSTVQAGCVFFYLSGHAVIMKQILEAFKLYKALACRLRVQVYESGWNKSGAQQAHIDLVLHMFQGVYQEVDQRVDQGVHQGV